MSVVEGGLSARALVASLSGRVTDDGWTVGEQVNKAIYQTGGAFSLGYLVTHSDGRSGFLKALDFSRIDQSSDKMRALEDLTRAYNFERDVLRLCNKSHLSKVVTAITDGSIKFEDSPFGEVFYLIFELADGDIRKNAVLSNKFDAVWTVRALHHVAVGMQQLHTNGIFHQDIKPSNILVFNDQTSKLADLGRSHCRSISAPHDMLGMPGARSYAPPEQLYLFELPDRIHARAAADLYHLGSMIYYMFTSRMLTPAMMVHLRDEHRPPALSTSDGGWTGTYADALPYISEGYGACIQELEQLVGDAFDRASGGALTADLISAFKWLSEPDPAKRGHPVDRASKAGSPYNLNRFISILDRVATRLEYQLKAYR